MKPPSPRVVGAHREVAGHSSPAVPRVRPSRPSGPPAKSRTLNDPASRLPRSQPPVSWRGTRHAPPRCGVLIAGLVGNRVLATEVPDDVVLPTAPTLRHSRRADWSTRGGRSGHVAVRPRCAIRCPATSDLVDAVLVVGPRRQHATRRYDASARAAIRRRTELSVPRIGVEEPHIASGIPARPDGSALKAAEFELSCRGPYSLLVVVPLLGSVDLTRPAPHDRRRRPARRALHPIAEHGQPLQGDSHVPRLMVADVALLRLPPSDECPRHQRRPAPARDRHHKRPPRSEARDPACPGPRILLVRPVIVELGLDAGGGLGALRPAVVDPPAVPRLRRRGCPPPQEGGGRVARDAVVDRPDAPDAHGEVRAGDEIWQRQRSDERRCC